MVKRQANSIERFGRTIGVNSGNSVFEVADYSERNFVDSDGNFLIDDDKCGPESG